MDCGCCCFGWVCGFVGWALEVGGHLGEFGYGVQVARGTFFGGGDFEAGGAEVAGVVGVDLAEAEAELFDGVIGEGFEGVGGGRVVEEDGDGLVAGHPGEGIVGEHGGHLGGGANEDVDGFAGVLCERGFGDWKTTLPLAM
jgi:hypothetical protein